MWIALSALSVAFLPLPGLKGPDLSSPKATFKSYVEAVRRGDAETAKKCWVIDGKDKDGALEVVVGMWTSGRRARVALTDKFGPKSVKVLGSFDYESLTDEALDRTMKLVETSAVGIEDGKTVLKHPPGKDGEPAGPVFLLADDPIPFRKVDGRWRIDATAYADGDAETLLKEGTWGPLFRDYAKAMNEVADGVRSGSLKTEEAAAKLFEERIKAAAKRYEEASSRNPLRRKP